MCNYEKQIEKATDEVVTQMMGTTVSSHEDFREKLTRHLKSTLHNIVKEVEDNVMKRCERDCDERISKLTNEQS